MAHPALRRSTCLPCDGCPRSFRRAALRHGHSERIPGCLQAER
jgi:hypothetical protein